MEKQFYIIHLVASPFFLALFISETKDTVAFVEAFSLFFLQKMKPELLNVGLKPMKIERII